MDFYIDIGVAVLLRALKSGDQRSKYRRAFLKVFKAIAIAFADDVDFLVVPEQLAKRED